MVRITIINIFVNIILSASKIISGTIFFSPALISDGVHSLSDLLTDFAVFFSYKISEKPKDESHPYGHGKVENIANIIIAGALIYAAIHISFSSYNAIAKGIAIKPSVINLIVIIASVISKEILYHMNKAAGIKLNCEPLITNAWHHRTDAISSFAVLIGITLGFIDKKLTIADPIVCFGISAFIIYIGGKILFETINKSIDKNIDIELESKIRTSILSNSEVISLHNLRGRYYGGNIIIDLHIQLDPEITLREAHKITHDVEKTIKNDYPQIIEVIIHTEPTNSA